MSEERWIVSIPLPFYSWFRCKCVTCGKSFWTMEKYKKHWRKEHGENSEANVLKKSR